MARKSLMSVDYEQLQAMVKEAMFTGGGINEPSAPEGIPHRMPAADPRDRQQDMGDPAANKLYETALVAREATEKLVEALDDPVYDSAYEYAFKASASLRRVLNSLEESGAHPMPIQRVVAPPGNMQKYNAYAGGGGGGLSSSTMIGGVIGGALEEQEKELKGFGSQTTSQSQQARTGMERSKEIASGKSLGGVDNKERGMLVQIEKILTKVANDDDLVKYRSQLETIMKNLLKRSEENTAKKDSPK